MPAELNNLPAPRTALIGRESELQATRALALQAPGRLLTLTGSGGSGKTSLAFQVARDLATDFADGVWLVELAALTDPALVPQIVAHVVGAQERPGVPILETRSVRGRSSWCWTTASI
jgi:predicted ATPase